MVIEELLQILDRSVEDVRTGRCSLDECLAEHADLRADLEPMLRIALEIEQPLDDDPVADAAARRRFLVALNAEPERLRWSARVRALFPSWSYQRAFYPRTIAAAL